MVWVGLINAVLSVSITYGFEVSGEQTMFNAKALPVGKSRISLFSGYRESTERLSPSGGRESLGSGFSEDHKVTGGRLTQNYTIRREQLSFIPKWSHGVLNSWTIGVQLPVTMNQVAVASSNTFRGADGQVESFSSAKVKESYGIDENVLPDEDIKIGNLQLDSLITVHNGPWAKYSFLQRIRFPSAEPSESDVVINALPGPSGYSVGVGLLGEWPVSRWTLLALTSYDAHLKDRVQVRGERRSSLHGYERDPGDQWEIRLGMEYPLYDWASLYVDFSHNQKAADVIENEILAEEYDAVMNTARIGFGFEDRLWIARLHYNTVLAGRNVDAADWLSMQLSLIY